MLDGHWVGIRLKKTFLKCQNKKIRVFINCTINPLNAFYFDKLDEWAKIHNIEIATSSCHGMFGIDALPTSLKSVLIEKYGLNHNIIKIIDATPEDINKSKKLIFNLENNDSKRNISWKEAFPDIVEYIK